MTRYPPAVNRGTLPTMANPNQITLAFSVATASTIYTPAQAAAKLAAVALYSSAAGDPVLGQAFGLTVAFDAVSDGGVTYSVASLTNGPFQPGETVTDSNTHTATVALDDNGMLFFVAGSASGAFVTGHTITGSLSGATATVVNATADGGPTSTTPGATRVLVLNMTSEANAPYELPYAPPFFPCRPAGSSLPAPNQPFLPPQEVLSASNTSPIVVGVESTEGLANGSAVTILGATGNTAANGTFTIAALTDDSFELVGSTGNGAYTGSGFLNPYELTETTTDPNTRLPVTAPAPATVVAFYSTSNLDTYGWPDHVDVLPAGPGAQIMELVYFDSTGARPFIAQKKLNGKFPAVVALNGGIDFAYIAACSVYQVGAFANSVGQITLCALEAPLPAIPTEATPADFPGLTDAAQLTITRPLVYLPPSYFALAQQGASAPQLAGDFLVKQGSPIVLTKVSQIGVVAATNVLEFAAQLGTQYEVASVSATFVKLATPYTGLSRPEIAPAAEASPPFPAQSVSEEADAVVTSACLVSPRASAGGPTQAVPPDDAHLLTLLAEFTVPQTTAPALTYVDEAGGPFTAGETVKGQKSGGTAAVLYDDQGIDATGVLAFAPGSVRSGFVQGETVVGQTSHATATVVVPSTLASNPLPTKLSGLYARTLSLVLGTPVVSQPMTLI